MKSFDNKREREEESQRYFSRRGSDCVYAPAEMKSVFCPQECPVSMSVRDRELPLGQRWEIHAASSPFHPLLNTHWTPSCCLGPTSESFSKRYLATMNSSWRVRWNLIAPLLQDNLHLLPFLPFAYQQLDPSARSPLLYPFLHIDAYYVLKHPCLGINWHTVFLIFIFIGATAYNCSGCVPDNSRGVPFPLKISIYINFLKIIKERVFNSHKS